MHDCLNNEFGIALALEASKQGEVSTFDSGSEHTVSARPLTALLASQVGLFGQKRFAHSRLTRANSCQNLFMSEYEKTEKVPKRTLELLDSLVRASAVGPEAVDLNPWLTAPFICHSDVAPILPSSRCFVEFMLTQNLKEQAILDFGSGSGILAVMARKLGASTVDAIDINPAAVAATRENASKSGFAEHIRVNQSDGFAEVVGRYDLILANLPMVDADALAGVFFGLFDPHFVLHRHFFSRLHRHLKPGGSAVICHSEFQEEWPFSRVESLIKENGLMAELAFQQTIENVDWQLYRITSAVSTK